MGKRGHSAQAERAAAKANEQTKIGGWLFACIRICMPARDAAYLARAMVARNHHRDLSPRRQNASNAKVVGDGSNACESERARARGR